MQRPPIAKVTHYIPTLCSTRRGHRCVAAKAADCELNNSDPTALRPTTPISYTSHGMNIYRGLCFLRCVHSRRMHTPRPLPSDKKCLLLGESLGIYSLPRGCNFLTLALSFPEARCVHILFIPILIKVTPLFAKGI